MPAGGEGARGGNKRAAVRDAAKRGQTCARAAAASNVRLPATAFPTRGHCCWTTRRGARRSQQTKTLQIRRSSNILVRCSLRRLASARAAGLHEAPIIPTCAQCRQLAPTIHQIYFQKYNKLFEYIVLSVRKTAIPKLVYKKITWRFFVEKLNF